MKTIVLVATTAFLLLLLGALACRGAEEEDIPTVKPTTISDPTPTPPNFTTFDVTSLAQGEVADAGLFPGDTEWVSCNSASWREASRAWVVTCQFYINRGDLLPDQISTYLFDDRTGHIDW